MKTATGIAFDDVGDGDAALLLLSGWGAPRTVYTPLLTRLAPHVRAIALDWRGHGGSAPANGDFGYAELLADAKSVIDAAGISRVIPVGLSHGGWAALDLRRDLGAARVPAIGLIDWMVLGAPPPFFDALAGLQTDQWAAVRERLFTMWTTGVTAPAVHAYVEQMRRTDGPMWQRAAREIAKRFATEPQPLAVIERDPCPTVHVYAQPADPAYLAAQQDYAAAHPWFAAHRVNASSHFPMLETPDEVASHLIELVTRAN